MKKTDPDERGPQETARLRDDSIRRMIATPKTRLKDDGKRPRVKPAKPRAPWKG